VSFRPAAAWSDESGTNTWIDGVRKLSDDVGSGRSCNNGRPRSSEGTEAVGSGWRNHSAAVSKSTCQPLTGDSPSASASGSRS